LGNLKKKKKKKTTTKKVVPHEVLYVKNHCPSLKYSASVLKRYYDKFTGR